MGSQTKVRRRAVAPARVRRVIHVLALGMACALVASACGARWSDEEKAHISARYDAAATQIVAGPSSGADEGPADQSAEQSRGDAASGNTAASDNVAGGGGGVTAQPAADAERQAAGDSDGAQPGAMPCAAPSNATGVTDDQITIGSIATQSGPIPGLGATFEAAVRSYVAYRNSTGGVCGREVVLKTTDDGADNARNRSLMTELGKEAVTVLMGPAGGADGGAEVVRRERILVVGVAISPKIAEQPTFFAVRPSLEDTSQVIGKYRYLKEQGVTKAAVVYVEQGTTEARINRDLMRTAGIEVVLDRPFPVTTLSYDSLARSVANSGANYMYFLHEFGASASMARSMAETGHPLLFNEYVTAYGSDFPELAGDAAEGASNWLFSLPVEDGDAVPELAALIEWMGRVSPGTGIDVFATQGWGSAKLALDALEQLPGPITSDGLLTLYQSMGDYDAGGLLAPANISARKWSGCMVGMVVEGGRWRRLAPSQGFLC